MSSILSDASSAPSTRGAASATPTATITLHGRAIVGGVAEGEALVTRERISGWGGIDPRTGTVIETRHELRGMSFAGKVLVFPGAKGSSGWSGQFHIARIAGMAPAAMLFNEMTTKMALGAVVTHAPSVTDFDRDPLSVIETGDWVRVDGETGTVTVTKRRDRTDLRLPNG
jgi:predicted aconitase with swiveling domain